MLAEILRFANRDYLYKIAEFRRPAETTETGFVTSERATRSLVHLHPYPTDQSPSETVIYLRRIGS